MMQNPDLRWTILIYKDKPIRKFEDGDFICYVANDIAAASNIKKASTSVAGYGEECFASKEDKQKYCIAPTKFRKGKYVRDDSMTLLTEVGVRRLLANSRTLESPLLAEFFGFDVHNAKYCAKETTTIGFIQQSLSGITETIHQYIVPSTKYRLDLYLPEHNIAIECDENNHSDRNSEYEQKREKEIISSLSIQNLPCRFIRFNPDSPDFNLAKVINSILLNMTN